MMRGDQMNCEKALQESALGSGKPF